MGGGGGGDVPYDNYSLYIILRCTVPTSPSPPPQHGISLCMPPSPPQHGISMYRALSPASDAWWPSLETRSNLFTSGQITPYPLLPFYHFLKYCNVRKEKLPVESKLWINIYKREKVSLHQQLGNI